MKMIKYALMAVALLTLTFCSSQSGEKDYLITLETDFGDIKMILYDETPKHKENFIKLASEGFYDGMLFHRVIENFMVQTGDPGSKEEKPEKPVGSGGPGYTIPAEFNPDLFHERGAVAAARQPDQINPEKESSGSQFYIVQGQQFTREQLTTDQNMLYYYFRQYIGDPGRGDLYSKVLRLQNENKYDSLQRLLIEYKEELEKEYDVQLDKDYPEERLAVYTTEGGAPHLDDDYTVFGKVVEGMDVVDKIAAQPKNGEKPVEPIRIQKVKVAEVSEKKLGKLYGVNL